MTTDTAARVTRIVIQDKGIRGCTSRDLGADTSSVKVDDIPYIDHPEIKINEHESSEMPFRYVKGGDGLPVMPQVSIATSPDICAG